MWILTFVLILFVYLLYKRQQQMSTFKRLGIPGPRPNFIFGHLIDIKNEGLHGLFPKWTAKYGPIVGFFIGGRPQVLITDFNLIRRVLIKDFDKFSDRNQGVPGGIYPTPQFQKMYVWFNGDHWRHMRATLSPTFSSFKLNAMEPLMMSSIEKLDLQLNDKAKSGEEFNISPIITEFTFSSAMKCIFGLDFSLKQSSKEAQCFTETSNPRLDKSMLAVAMLLFPSLSFIACPLRVLWERFRLYMLWSPEGVCYNIAKQVVHARRAAKTESNDFLQILMNAKRIESTTDMDLEMSSDDVKPNKLIGEMQNENLSEEEILANALLFLMAGNETTKVTFLFCLHNLIVNQDVQEKLRNELRKVVEKGSHSISFSALSKVPLLNHVVKETLRMFPPIMPITARVANEDYEYEGTTIPKGISVYIGVSSIHNDPNLWPEPEKFRPERFENDFDKLAFLSFGAGPRNCIGMRFAYMEVQLALANLILKYRLEAGPSTETKIETVEGFATLTPKNAIMCKVTRLVE